MLISKDHDCTPYCTVCISEEDLLKSLPTRKIVPKPMSYASMLVAIVAVLCYCSLPNGQVHKFHERTGGLDVRQTSIGLAEKLEVIELLSKDIRQSATSLAERLKVLEVLSKDVRFSLAESAHIMAAKESRTSIASGSPNHGPSLSPDNHDSATPAHASDREKKLDGAAKPDPPGRGFPLLNQLRKAILLSTATLLSVGLAIVLSMVALLTLALPLLSIKLSVTTGSRQSSTGFTDRVELSEPRMTDGPSAEIIEAARIMRKLSTGSAEWLEVSERRQAVVPSSPVEVAHLMVTQEACTSATDYPNPGPSPSPDNHDSPPDAWQMWEFTEREEA